MVTEVIKLVDKCAFELISWEMKRSISAISKFLKQGQLIFKGLLHWTTPGPEICIYRKYDDSTSTVYFRLDWWSLFTFFDSAMDHAVHQFILQIRPHMQDATFILITQSFTGASMLCFLWLSVSVQKQLACWN